MALYSQFQALYSCFKASDSNLKPLDLDFRASTDDEKALARIMPLANKQSRAVFELIDGQPRTYSGLAKSVKTKRSTIDWQHTRKVLLDSYGQAHGFAPPNQDGAMDDFDKVFARDESESDTDTDTDPDTDTEAAIVDPTNPPTRPSSSKAPKIVSIRSAILTIMQDMRERNNIGEGLEGEGVPNMDAGDRPDDAESSLGTGEDQRHMLSFEKKGRQMLLLYFESLKLKTGNEIPEWYGKPENAGRMPTRCYRAYSIGAGWFPDRPPEGWQVARGGRFTADEAHMLRNLDSTYYIGARLLPTHETLLVTGTPQFNGTQDILAYANIFAARSDLDRYLWVTAKMPINLTDVVRSSEEAMEQGYVSWKPGQDVDAEFISQLHEWANKDLPRRQWWCLLDGFRIMLRYKRNAGWASVFLSSFISLRRMKTKLCVNGRDIYPGASMPECRIRTVELSFKPDDPNLIALQHLASAAVKFVFITGLYRGRRRPPASSEQN